MVVHPREKRSKCTVEPLRSRDDFQSRQADDPFLLAMGRPEQRSLVVQ